MNELPSFRSLPFPKPPFSSASQSKWRLSHPFVHRDQKPSKTQSATKNNQYLQESYRKCIKENQWPPAFSTQFHHPQSYHHLNTNDVLKGKNKNKSLWKEKECLITISLVSFFCWVLKKNRPLIAAEMRPRNMKERSFPSSSASHAHSIYLIGRSFVWWKKASMAPESR